jgi:lysozyme
VSTDRDTRLFKVIRDLLGRGLTQGEVDRVNAALYAQLVTAPERRTSAEGVALIHSFESCKLKAYPDPGSRDGKPVTIGWGSTTDENGKPIMLGTVWSQARADARFRLDLAKFEQGVSLLLGDAPTTQSQFDALVSFAYNVGLDIDTDDKAEGLGDSTLLKRHKAGNYAGAQASFAAWNKNDGKVLNGLIRRRAEEASLYGRDA